MNVVVDFSPRTNVCGKQWYLFHC